MHKNTKRNLVDIDKIEEYASKLLNRAQIATMIGVSPSTFAIYEKENAEITEAINRGRHKSVGEVVNKLYQGAMKGNTTAQIYILKTHGGNEWKEKQDLNITTDKPIEIKFVDDLKE